MTQLRQRALLTLVIWGLVIATFIPLFFSGGGPDTYQADKIRRLSSNICIALGYTGYLVMIILTRKRSKGKRRLRDERDEITEKQANQIAFIFVLVYVFITCIILWEKFHDVGSVPVGFMWFLAYTTVSFSYFFASATTLIIDLKNYGYAQG